MLVVPYQIQQVTQNLHFGMNVLKLSMHKLESGYRAQLSNEMYNNNLNPKRFLGKNHTTKRALIK